MLDSIKDECFKRFAGIKILTVEEEKDLVLNRKNKKSRDKLIKSFLPLVLKLSRKYAGKFGMRYLEDFIQEGAIGLIRGIDKFKYTECSRVSIYVERCIIREIIRFVNSRIRIVRLPENVHWRFQEARSLLWEFGSFEEALKNVEGDVKRSACLKKALELVKRDEMLRDSVLYDDEYDRNFIGMNIEEEKRHAHVAHKKAVKKLLFFLDERERDLLQLRFIYGYDFSEIGKMYGISKQRVDQLLKRALKRLHQTLNSCAKLKNRNVYEYLLSF